MWNGVFFFVYIHVWFAQRCVMKSEPVWRGRVIDLNQTGNVQDTAPYREPSITRDTQSCWNVPVEAWLLCWRDWGIASTVRNPAAQTVWRRVKKKFPLLPRPAIRPVICYLAARTECTQTGVLTVLIYKTPWLLKTLPSSSNRQLTMVTSLLLMEIRRRTRRWAGDMVFVDKKQKYPWLTALIKRDRETKISYIFVIYDNLLRSWHLATF